MRGWLRVNKIKSILLISVNPITYPAAPPYGLEILASFLDTNGFQTEIFNPFQISLHPFSTIKKKIISRDYLFIGISFRNWDEAGFSYRLPNPPSFTNIFLKVIKIIKEFVPNIPVIVGGSGFSISPERLLKLADINFGIQGPGEHSIVDFANCVKATKNNKQLLKLIEEKVKLNKLNGFVLRKEYDFVINKSPNKYIEPPFRYIDEQSHYSVKLLGGTIPIRTKIGCPKKCSYCVVPFIEPLSLRTIDGINNEIQFFLGRGEGHRFFFADSEVNLPSKEWFHNLLDNLIYKYGKSRIGWMGYLYPTKNFEASEGKKLFLSGCRGVSFTVDSLHDDILKYMLKNYRTNNILQMIEILLKAKINVQINLLLGGPGENSDTIDSQIEIIKKLAKIGVKFSINIGLRVYDNTPLYQISQKEKFRKFFYDTNYTPIFCSPMKHTKLGKVLYSKLKDLSNVQFTEEHSNKINRTMLNLSIGARYLISNDFHKAEKYLNNSLSYEYEPFRARLALARLYTLSNKIDKAEKIIQTI
jgi:radical SAM superfamily enzyme YgiQ (UPF0313 family)